jgi:hypothetical protein
LTPPGDDFGSAAIVSADAGSLVAIANSFPQAAALSTSC